MWIFIIYLGLLIFLGLKARRKNPTEEEFLLNNRSLSIPAFVATLVTTWYGGILGVGEFIHSYGVSAWFVFGLPYYIFALLFALFLAPKIRAANNISIPDMLYNTYNKKAGLLGSLFLLIMTSPAPYILMLAVLIQSTFNISFINSVLLGTFFSVFYVFWGGFRSIVQTDKLQFVLMFSGFILLLIYMLKSPVSLTDLPKQLDAAHKSLSGGLPWQQIIVWFFIASWTFIDPGFHQRCAAARSPQTARRGIIISIGFWFVFDMLTLLTGLYAFVFFPDIDPLTIYPHAASHFLPPVLQGLFLTGLLAIIMSTVDSFTFLSALTFGRDIMWRWKNNLNINSYVRIGLVLTAVISILLIFWLPSVIELWYNLGSLFIPPLLLPLLFTYFPKFKMSARLTTTVMASAFLLAFSWFLWGQINAEAGMPVYPFELEPFFPGLLWSVLLYTANYFLRKNQIYSTKQ